MPSYHLNMMIVQGLPDARVLRDWIEDHAQPPESDFGVIRAVGNEKFVEADIYKKKSKNVNEIDEHRRVSSVEVGDLKVIRFKVWFDRGRIEVYTGTVTDCEDLLDFFSEINVKVQHVFPSLDIVRAVHELQTRPSFKVKRIEGAEYLGPGEADGSFIAKFNDVDDAMRFLEGDHGAHVQRVQVSFQAGKRASITLTPNGCFGITCNEGDMYHMQDICRDLVKVAVRESAE